MDKTNKSDLKIIRSSELCELLGISHSTIWQWTQSGKLPPKVKIGTRYAGWRARDIDAFLEKHTGKEPVSA